MRANKNAYISTYCGLYPAKTKAHNHTKKNFNKKTTSYYR